jgi:hypothetical protein
MTPPKLQLIVGYENIIGPIKNLDRISLIEAIPLRMLIYEIAGLNHRLKTNVMYLGEGHINIQYRELGYFSRAYEDKRYFNAIIKYSKHEKNKNVMIFSRQSCAFALEEIINSDRFGEDFNYKMNFEDLDKIFRYLLAVNSELVKITGKPELNTSTFEHLNAKLLTSNELTLHTDLIYAPYRGYQLCNFLEKDDEFKNVFNEYFESIGISYKVYIEQILLMTVVLKYNDNREREFDFIVENSQDILFEFLSIRYLNNDTIKLLSIRKSPFIKVEDLKLSERNLSRYILADHGLLAEKSYYQFINDFWFECVKLKLNDNNKPHFTIKDYGSKIGKFFEDYVEKIFRAMLNEYPYSMLLLFDELKDGKDQNELADIYFRNRNKIFICQVKAGKINSKQKFGGDLMSFYDNNRNKFFSNFGVNQLVNSIKNIEDRISQNLDKDYPVGSQRRIFPALIVDDLALKTPLMASVFNIRFKELMSSYNGKKVNINSLILIHISDLESIEELISKTPKKFWDILEKANQREGFIYPFNSIIRRYDENLTKNIPKKIDKFYKEMFNVED